MVEGNKITIDPGIAGTGFALWNNQWKLRKSGCVSTHVRRGREDTWLNRAEAITYRINKLIQYYGVDEGHVELPAYFQSAGGQTVARGGSLVKLTILTGMILYLPGFKYIEIAKWKGQLPKEIVNKRIREKLHSSELKHLNKAESHDWDAVGIGLYLRGDL